MSYWSKSDCKIIVEKLNEVINSGQFKDLYWDDIVKDNISKLDVQIRKIQSDDCFEIDSLKDLENVKKYISIK